MSDTPKDTARAPKAFVLGKDGAARPEITEEPDFVVAEAPVARAAAPQTNWLSRLFWGALGVLLSLFAVDAVWSLFVSLSEKNVWLGRAALGFAGLLGFVFVLFLLRELFALLKMRKVDALKARLAAARVSGAKSEALAALDALAAFYADDAGGAAARAAIRDADQALSDAPTLLDLGERAFLADRDLAAREAIAAAAQRVSLVTALSPRALFDVLFVVAQSAALVRRMSTIYGGRASGLGLWRLGSRVLSHLAITGGVAVADSVLSSLLGAGVAAKLSAKLGEGLLNGVLTARVGIAAQLVCRPMEFSANAPVSLSEVVKSIRIQ